MTFLALEAGLLAGAGATLAIIVPHMLRLRRRPLRVSTIRFWPGERVEREANVPIRAPRASVSLLLQLAGAWALAGALARPVAGPAHADAGDRVVIVLDRSASMSSSVGAGEPGRTRLALAIEAARDVVRDAASRSASITLVSASADARVESGPTRVARDVLRALDSIAPSDEPLDEARAAEVVRALRAGDDASSAHVVLITDGDVTPTLAREANRVRGVVAAGPSPNIGVTTIAVVRDEREPSLARAFVRVTAGTPDAPDVPVVFSINDTPVASRSTAFERGPESSSAGVGVVLECPGACVIRARLARDDSLPADNEARVVLDAPSAPRIVLVVPDADPTADPPPPPSERPIDLALPGDPGVWILADLLEEVSPGRVRVVAARDFDPEHHLGDVLVLDRVSPARLGRTPSLSFAGAPAPWRMEPADGPVVALGWDRAHPLLRDVALDSLFVESPLRLVAEAPASIATSPAGPLIASGAFEGVERVVVAFDVARSNWPAQAGFPIFVANAIEHLSRSRDARRGRSFRAGDPIRMGDGPWPARVRLRGPIEVERDLIVSEGSAWIGPVGRAGLYEIHGRDERLAINLADERETLARARAEFSEAGPGSSRAGDGARDRARVFVLVALALLTLEWFLWAWSRVRGSRARAA